MQLIIFDQLCSHKADAYKDFSLHEKQEHTMFFARDSANLVIPRIGEKVSWHNGKTLWVESVRYKYGSSLNEIDDKVIVFGRAE